MKKILAFLCAAIATASYAALNQIAAPLTTESDVFTTASSIVSAPTENGWTANGNATVTYSAADASSSATLDKQSHLEIDALISDSTESVVYNNTDSNQKLVRVDMMVYHTDIDEMDAPSVGNGAQTAIRVFKDSDTLKYAAYVKTTADATAAEWVTLSGSPVAREWSHIAVEFDYRDSSAAKVSFLKVDDDSASTETRLTYGTGDSAITWFYLAKSATALTSTTFRGYMDIASFSATQADVVDSSGVIDVSHMEAGTTVSVNTYVGNETTPTDMSSYYTEASRTVKSGNTTVTLKLNPEVVTPAASAMTMPAEKVAITPSNVKKGLYYGLAVVSTSGTKTTTTVGTMQQATSNDQSLSLENSTLPSGDSKVLYYQLVVSDSDVSNTSKETTSGSSD